MCDISEPDWTSQVRFQELLRPPNQTARGATRLRAPGVGLERRTKQCDHRLLGTEPVPVPADGVMQKTCSQVLEEEVRASASTTEQRVDRKRPSARVSELGEDTEIRRDDQLRVIAREWLAQIVALAARDEQHLVRVANDLVIADMPHEQTTIGQTDLEIGAEVLRRFPETHARTSHVLDKPDARLQQSRSRRLPRIADSRGRNLHRSAHCVPPRSTAYCRRSACQSCRSAFSVGSSKDSDSERKSRQPSPFRPSGSCRPSRSAMGDRNIVVARIERRHENSSLDTVPFSDCT